MPRRLSLKQRRFINEYLKNGGNATQAALQVYDTNYETARVMGSENLSKPSIKNEIERQLCTSGVEQALEVVFEALHARTANGKPHWVSRLRAADLIFRLSHSYDRKEPEEQEQVQVSFDWSGVPLPIVKYFAKHGRWPEPEIEQRLLNGETLYQIEKEAEARELDPSS